jgi:hypothetical protein
MTTKETNPLRLIDEALPRFDAREIHEMPVHAALDVVYAAIKSVTARDVRLLTLLEVLRALPGLLVGRRPFRPTSSAALIEEFTAGVVPLGERAGKEGKEIVAGAIGRYWLLWGNQPAPLRTREEFLAFSEPGYTKAVVAFSVRAESTGCRVTTETRVAGTSPEATRAFRRYWLLIRPASGAIRRSWLAAIRRRAVHAR